MDTPILVAMGSSQTGIGKSFILSNIAYLLAKSGLHVTLIDLNLAYPAFASFFRLPDWPTLSDFFDQSVELTDLSIAPFSHVPKLNVIPSQTDSPLKASQLGQLSESCRRLQTDVVLWEGIGGGTTKTSELLISADRCIFVEVPDDKGPSRLSHVLKTLMRTYLTQIFSAQTPLSDATLANWDPTQKQQALALMQRCPVQCIVNQVTDSHDSEVVAIKSVMKQWFGKENCLGIVPHSPQVEKASKQYRPFYEIDASGTMTRSLIQIAQKLMRWLKHSVPSPLETIQEVDETTGNTWGQHPLFENSVNRNAVLTEDDFALETNPFGSPSVAPQAANGAEFSSNSEDDEVRKAFRNKEVPNPTIQLPSDVDLTLYSPNEGFKPIDIIGFLPPGFDKE